MKQNNKQDNRVFFRCECFNTEHLIIFDYSSDDDGFDDISLEFHLVHYRNIFKRIYVAIKYIFGYKSKYGSFDCIIINYKTALKIKKFFNKYIKYINNKNND